MRQPTPDHKAYDWWTRALAGEEPPITTEPQCGYFRMKLVRGGPWVGVRIFLAQEIERETGELAGDERMECRVDGKARDPAETWLRCADNPIPRDEFRFICATATWAEQHAPSDPAANPRRRIDPLKQPLTVFPAKGTPR